MFSGLLLLVLLHRTLLDFMVRKINSLLFCMDVLGHNSVFIESTIKIIAKSTKSLNKGWHILKWAQSFGTFIWIPTTVTISPCRSVEDGTVVLYSIVAIAM